jgi:hypothetical protein
VELVAEVAHGVGEDAGDAHLEVETGTRGVAARVTWAPPIVAASCSVRVAATSLKPPEEALTMASEKTRGAPKKQTKKPKAPSTAKAARREAAKKAHQSSQSPSV